MKTALSVLALALCLACQGTPSESSADPAADLRPVEIVVLEHLEAAEAAEVLQDLVEAASAGGQAPALEILPDVDTNSLLIRAEDETLAQLKDLIAALDTNRTAGG